LWKPKIDLKDINTEKLGGCRERYIVTERAVWEAIRSNPERNRSINKGP